MVGPQLKRREAFKAYIKTILIPKNLLNTKKKLQNKKILGAEIKTGIAGFLWQPEPQHANHHNMENYQEI
ncbi:unnamed protein product [Ceutorhynchus assimilis]|uniref:Uncharacterized protein n=1 Tax=Ceutorhynchus assimilis TaxID=467358 RepID=A0A9N9N1W2_9CUCU|nr:unnamed protein product [Ceutorhynchus assimilis]